MVKIQVNMEDSQCHTFRTLASRLETTQGQLIGQMAETLEVRIHNRKYQTLAGWDRYSVDDGKVYELLDELAWVDYVEDVTLTLTPSDAGRIQFDKPGGDVTGVRLYAHELVEVEVTVDIKT